MPLHLQHHCNGAPIEYRWGRWHQECFAHALDEEGVPGGWPMCHTFGASYIFEDPDDGEIMTIQAGDELHAWR